MIPRALPDPHVRPSELPAGHRLGRIAPTRRMPLRSCVPVAGRAFEAAHQGGPTASYFPGASDGADQAAGEPRFTPPSPLPQGPTVDSSLCPNFPAGSAVYLRGLEDSPHAASGGSALGVPWKPKRRPNGRRVPHDPGSRRPTPRGPEHGPQRDQGGPARRLPRPGRVPRPARGPGRLRRGLPGRVRRASGDNASRPQGHDPQAPRRREIAGHMDSPRCPGSPARWRKCSVVLVEWCLINRGNVFMSIADRRTGLSRRLAP